MTLEQHIAEILERAAKTFVEALVATLLLTPVSTMKSVAVGGLGALISAAWTTAIKLEGSKVTDLEADAEHLFLDDDEDDEDEDDEEDEPEVPAPGAVVAPAPPTSQPSPVMPSLAQPQTTAAPQVDTANAPIGSQAQ